MSGRRSGPDGGESTRSAIRVVLQAGLAVTVILIAAGMVVGFLRGETRAPAVRLSDLWGSLALQDRLETAGIVALILTPSLAVATLVVSWARERDLRAVLIGSAVALILVASVLAGHA